MQSKWLIVFAVFATFYATSARAQGTVNAPNQKTIEVSGHGEEKAKPDTMIVSFAIDSQAPAAAAATQMQSEKTRKVVDALKGKAGADAKVETSDFQLNSNFVAAQPGVSTPNNPEEPKSIWTFKIDVTAYSPTIENLGELIQAGMAAGATYIAGSGFEQLPDDEPQSARSAGGGAASAFRSFNQERMQPTKMMATVSLDIQSEGTSPDEVVRRASSIEAKVEQALRDKLHGKGSVKILQFGIVRAGENNPRMRYQPAPPPPQQQVYNAHTTVTVETRNLDALGPLIESGMSAGATRLDQVSFTLREDSAARNRAIDKAAADAKNKAATLASSMGVKLGAALHISTNAIVHPQIVYGSSFAAMHTATASGFEQSMPVMPHEIGYSADVNVVYQIE
jgi:uncharacterized protein YggE